MYRFSCSESLSPGVAAAKGMKTNCKVAGSSLGSMKTFILTKHCTIICSCTHVDTSGKETNTTGKNTIISTTCRTICVRLINIVDMFTLK